jgi:predicted amidophosphoribosyltransferase
MDREICPRCSENLELKEKNYYCDICKEHYNVEEYLTTTPEDRSRLQSVEENEKLLKDLLNKEI